MFTLGLFLLLVICYSNVVIVVNTSKEDSTMTSWNKLLAALDETLGFSNKVSSRVRKLKQAYDNNKNEHVIWLEYRIKVNTNRSPVKQELSMAERKMEFLKRVHDDLVQYQAERRRLNRH